MCWDIFGEATRISSKHTCTFIPLSNSSITRCTMAGAEDMPYGNLLYWKSPLGVFRVNIGFETSSNSNYSKQARNSNFVKTEFPDNAEGNSSGRGNRYASAATTLASVAI